MFLNFLVKKNSCCWLKHERWKLNVIFISNFLFSFSLLFKQMLMCHLPRVKISFIFFFLFHSWFLSSYCSSAGIFFSSFLLFIIIIILKKWKTKKNEGGLKVFKISFLLMALAECLTKDKRHNKHKQKILQFASSSFVYFIFLF